MKSESIKCVGCGCTIMRDGTSSHRRDFWCCIDCDTSLYHEEISKAMKDRWDKENDNNENMIILKR